MKRIRLVDRGIFKAREVITGMVESPLPNQGVTYQEMRKRDRLLDALERHKSDRYFDLEDADFDHLVQILNASQFLTAKRELRLILDDIATAKSPEETTQLKVVEGEAG